MGWWKRFLDSIIKANEKQFHGKPPSCCSGRVANEGDKKVLVKQEERESDESK